MKVQMIIHKINQLNTQITDGYFSVCQYKIKQHQYSCKYCSHSFINLLDTYNNISRKKQQLRYMYTQFQSQKLKEHPNLVLLNSQNIIHQVMKQIGGTSNITYDFCTHKFFLQAANSKISAICSTISAGGGFLECQSSSNCTKYDIVRIRLGDSSNNYNNILIKSLPSYRKALLSWIFYTYQYLYATCNDPWTLILILH
ncbi:unnamed protein product [Paramecium pentaurelia]|uniref:Uncharacterized protein n=1 Tax=Paramecium pentaurelia TaxID=43138 RepID=A0A8S1U9A3_9CILI|nr:unnamed protein product [Paramecium pentaurelia]